jgi:hypothetical protein
MTVSIFVKKYFTLPSSCRQSVFSQLLAPAHWGGPLLSKRAPPREMDFRPGSAIGPNGVVFTNPRDSGLGNFSIVGLPEIGLFIPSRSLLATNPPLFSLSVPKTSSGFKILELTGCEQRYSLFTSLL